jgi:hypothetical protein
VKGILKESLEQVYMVKNDDPIPKDVIKAAANVTGDVVTYNQGYCAIKLEDKNNFVSAKDSYKLIVLYLTQFKELNPSAELHYEVLDGKIESLFVCLDFMNVSLCCV